MNFWRFFIALFLILASILSAKPVTVTGIIPGGENEEIRLMAHGDQISYKPLIVGRATVNDSGSFSISTSIHQISLVSIEIGFYSSPLVLVPEQIYELLFDSIKLKNEFRPFYQKEPLFYEITDEPYPQMNAWLSAFEERHTAFIAAYFETFSRRRDASALETFRSKIQREFLFIEEDYFDVYVEYKLATLELVTASSGKPAMFERFIKNRPVHYHNPEYMNFFNTFFDQYLPGNNRFISRRDISAVINFQPDFKVLMDTLGKDTLLMNEVIRELVLLKTMKELYHNRSFSSTNILAILDQVGKMSKFAGHRTIARSLIEELTLLEQGFPAPDFRLQDLQGNIVQLADLSGKPAYIFFMTLRSHGCLVEFDRMSELYKRYGDEIHFVTVSFDESPTTIDDFKKHYGFEWLFLFNGSAFDLIHDYRIKTFPIFVLIDSNGFVVEYPAFKPSEIIEQSFEKLLR